MKDRQLTLRLPRDLDRALSRRANERGIPKSQLVREALQVYLTGDTSAEPGAAWRRVAPMVGSLALDATAIASDALADQVRAHNWRE